LQSVAVNTMSKISIKNKEGQNIFLLLDIAKPQKGLAFVLHGLGGFKEQLHVQIMADAFKDAGYTVVNFDAINSLGESNGNYEDSTVTTHLQSLLDVIDWAKTQEWYQEPFCLAGHSLGAMAVTLYAEENPDKVRALAPISTVVSGELSREAHEKYKSDEFKKWQETGWLIKESTSRPGWIKKLPWSHMENRLKYDLLQGADKLKMPVLLVVGSEDIGTLPEHQKILLDKLPGQKELHIIQGSPHTFRELKHLEELKKILDSWIKKL